MQVMQRLQAYKFELRPKPGRAAAFRRTAGCCRCVYNRALAEQQARYERGESHLGYTALCRALAESKQADETAFPAEPHSQPLQQSLKDPGRAYTNFFAGRADPPRFKKRGRHDAFRYPQPKSEHIDQANDRIFQPKIGWVRYRNSRAIEGVPKNITVVLEAGHWFVSVQTERTVPNALPTATTAVGVDLGVVRFATLSDGIFYKPLDSFRVLEDKLAREQRKLARKTKFSRNWKKQKRRIAVLHRHIADARKDYLHKVSTDIGKNHAMVAVEDLKVSNMSASAKGTAERPGRNVRAKAGLNKAILDQGWFSFRRMLDYKLAWNGGWLVAVDPRNTSRECPACHHVDAANRTAQARFRCTACGFAEHADLVGAVNILSRGMQKLRDEGQDTNDASFGCASTARIACSRPQGPESQA